MYFYGLDVGIATPIGILYILGIITYTLLLVGSHHHNRRLVLASLILEIVHIICGVIVATLCITLPLTGTYGYNHAPIIGVLVFSYGCAVAIRTVIEVYFCICIHSFWMQMHQLKVAENGNTEGNVITNV